MYATVKWNIYIVSNTWGKIKSINWRFCDCSCIHKLILSIFKMNGTKRPRNRKRNKKKDRMSLSIFFFSLYFSFCEPKAHQNGLNGLSLCCATLFAFQRQNRWIHFSSFSLFSSYYHTSLALVITLNSFLKPLPILELVSVNQMIQK